MVPPAEKRQIKVLPAFNEDRVMVRVEEMTPDWQSKGVRQLRSQPRGWGAGLGAQGREVGPSLVLPSPPGGPEQVIQAL